LQKAAQQIVEGGGFPDRYDDIRALAGVGDYTAAAVASIAFDLPHAVLDGNVIRVFSRLTGDDGDVRATATRERLRAAAESMLDPRRPGDFNQALMELGATLCLPRDPQCLLCPLSGQCTALREGRQNEIPVKGPRRDWVRIEQTLLLARRNGCVLLRQRPPDVSRMPGFWELPEAREIPGARMGVELGWFRHTITHHIYRVRVVEAAVRRTPRGMQWKPLDTLNEVPLSTTARKALQRCKKL
jgi:A/G-specific adenine glycosylase